MAVFTPALSAIRQQIGRNLGLLRATGSVLVAPTATTIFSNAIIYTDSNDPIGMFLYFNEGADIQDERTVTAYTPYSATSASLIARLDVLRPFASVPSTNSAFELWEKLRPTDVNQAIIEAVRRMGRKQLVGREDFSIILNSPVRNGGFDSWLAGTTSAPDGWTLAGTSGTISRVTQPRYGGRYSAAVLNGASQLATLESDNLPEWARYADRSVTAYARVYAPAGSRARLQIDDGVGQTNSDYAASGFSEISVTRTIAVTPTKLTILLRTETGTAITVN